MDCDTKTPSETYAYIARCKCGCGGIVFASVDNPEHVADVARDVANCIRDGYVIERVTVGLVRAHPFGCQVPKEALKTFWLSERNRKSGVLTR